MKSWELHTLQRFQLCLLHASHMLMDSNRCNNTNVDKKCQYKLPWCLYQIIIHGWTFFCAQQLCNLVVKLKIYWSHECQRQKRAQNAQFLWFKLLANSIAYMIQGPIYPNNILGMNHLPNLVLRWNDFWMFVSLFLQWVTIDNKVQHMLFQYFLSLITTTNFWDVPLSILW